MNKRDLIGKYNAERAKLRPYCPNRNRKEEQLKSTIYTNIIDDLNQLDEPQKPVVPKFVAEWFEDNKHDLDNAIFGYIVFWEERDTESVLYQWFAKSKNKPIETIFRMKDGYEVEQEPLYMVPLLTDKEGNKKILVERRGEYDIIWDYESEGDWHELLTEEQIKSVNPDYWKLAVLYEPNEEVA